MNAYLVQYGFIHTCIQSIMNLQNIQYLTEFGLQKMCFLEACTSILKFTDLESSKSLLLAFVEYFGSWAVQKILEDSTDICLAKSLYLA